MLRKIVFVIAALWCSSLPAFSQSPESETAFKNDYPAGTPRVKAACFLPPIRFIIDRIGGEFVDSISLIPAGYDPHTFEPKSSQLAIFSQADIYFNLGTPVEEVWLGRLGSLDCKLQVVDLIGPLVHDRLLLANAHGYTPSGFAGAGEMKTSGEADGKTVGGKTNPAEAGASASEGGQGPAAANTPAAHSAQEHLGHEHHDYDGNDPHVWMSPTLLKRLAAVVCAGLSEQMPEQAAYFDKNYQALVAQIDAVDADAKSLLAGLPESKRIFLVFHPSWSYFAREYALTQMAVEHDGKEPTPTSLAITIQEARSKGISVIFVQKEFNPGVAETVAAHLPGGRVELLDPLGYNPLQAIREAAAAISSQGDTK